MTRADINIVLPNGKVMHWYQNGDQYVTGIRDWYALDILLHELQSGYYNAEKYASLNYKKPTIANLEKYIRAWFNFTYAGLLRGYGCTIDIREQTEISSGEDYGYVIDLKNGQFTAYNWGDVIFHSEKKDDNGEPVAWLSKAFDWLRTYTDDMDVYRALEECGFEEPKPELITKVSEYIKQVHKANLIEDVKYAVEEMELEPAI